MPLKVMSIQMWLQAGNLAAHEAQIKKAYTKACQEGLDIVLTPELSLTGYGVEDKFLEQDFLDNAWKRAEALAKITTETTALIFGVPQPSGRAYDALGRAHQSNSEKPYNAMLVAWGGKIQHICQKKELATYGVFHESRWFQAGEGKSFKFKGHHIALPICADFWSDDALEPYLKENPEVILVPNASTYEVGKHQQRKEILTQRVKKLKTPVIYLNWAGAQDEVLYDGNSMALLNAEDPLVKAASFEEDVMTIDLDTQKIVTEKSVPELSQQAEMYKACVTGLKAFFAKHNQEKALLGLSGGVDSALVAAIACDALDAKNVQAYMLPYNFTSDESKTDADALAQSFGLSLATVPIAPAVDGLTKMFEELDAPLQGVAHENAQSRSRALFLMAMSNTTGAWLLSTGNKSELAVGYATLYGDMCGAFNPIKDLYKTDVYALCKWRNSAEGQRLYGTGAIPENILTKAPTAELRANQKDQDSLPDYDVLDAILRAYIEEKKTSDEMLADGFKKEEIELVINLVERNEFKRRQAPPGSRLQAVSFAKLDRLYPLK